MTGGLGSYLEMFGILVLFFLILYGAYLASRFAARFQSGRVSGNNMTIIEAISVGPQKTLQIIRVGKTYMVVGVSKDQITYLREIDPSELQLSEEAPAVPFSSILDKVVRRNKDEASVSGAELHGLTGEEQDDR